VAFTVAQISDTHLSDSKPFFVANFDHTAAALRESKPDLVVNTGDVSLNGADLLADLRFAHARHADLGLDWRAIAGNHDVGDCIEVARGQPVNTERLARWQGVFGDLWWSMDVPGWRILAVDALLLGSGLPQDAAQLDFIRDAAATLAGRALLLMMHKPAFDRNSAETGQDSAFLTRLPRMALHAALGGARPRIVASGHVHQWRQLEMNGTLHVTAPAIAFVTPPWFHAGFGVRTIGYIEHVLEDDGSFRSGLVGVSRTTITDLEDFPAAYGDVNRWRPA
jgi:hypothetical protein